MSLFDDPDEGEPVTSPSPENPVTPYAGTSGWSGSDTSEARALHADESGITGRNQQEALRFLRQCGPRGATWREVGVAIDAHHGIVSGALSALHQEHYICRLSETRERCKVYVVPEHVNMRATEPYTPNTQKASDAAALRVADLFLDYLDQRDDAAAQMRTWEQMRQAAERYRESR